jgi:mRNA interferase YafQ
MFESAFIEALWKLANDEPLPESFCDHSLTGKWQDFRDCHIRPDLILIYRKPNAVQLQLVRLGSHSESGL